MNYPLIGMYSHCNGAGEPFLFRDRSLNLEAIQQQARWDTVILDVAAPLRVPEMLAEMRRINPNIRLLAYVMGAVFWTNPHPAIPPKEEDFPWLYQQVVRGTNGELFANSGRYWEFCNVNLANTQTVDALTTLIIDRVIGSGLWDGIFFDVSPSQLFLGGQAETPDTIDYRRAGFTDVRSFMAAWKVGHERFMGRIKAAAPEFFTITVNGVPHEYELLNGGMRENFPFQHVRAGQDGWRENMLQNGFGVPGYLTEPFAAPKGSWLCSEPRFDKDMSAQRHRFGLGSATLGDGFHSFGRHEWEPHRFWWYPEYDFNGRRKGWLGAPLRDAAPEPSGLWVREFEHGVVVVNPTGTLQKYSPSRPLRPPKSGWKKIYNIASHDALFLGE